MPCRYIPSDIGHRQPRELDLPDDDPDSDTRLLLGIIVRATAAHIDVFVCTQKLVRRLNAMTGTGHGPKSPEIARTIP